MNETNLSLWRRHCHTDPDTTKAVNQRGGYTAINPQSQAEAATAEFGPYGYGWGLTDLQYQFHTISGDKAQVVLTLECRFFYYFDGEMYQFQIAADMPYRAGDDAYKKLRTQCQSKALSLLGFNADIFAGDWEDETYRTQMKTKFGDQETRRQKGLEAIAKASAAMLDNIEAKVDREAGDGTLDALVAEHLRARIAERREQLSVPPTTADLVASGELEPQEDPAVGLLFDNSPKAPAYS